MIINVYEKVLPAFAERTLAKSWLGGFSDGDGQGSLSRLEDSEERRSAQE